MSQNNKFILALDQGTTSSRAIVFNHSGEVVSVSQQPFQQFFPNPGWVEHDPAEIWKTQFDVAQEALKKAGILASSIAAIGITNQRETTIVWDKNTGNPVYNAIVWQDRRTSKFCDEIRDMGFASKIREKTGLIVDAYFSATKIKWILDNVSGARKRAEKGELCFGTVDCWLAWKFSGGKIHVTDVSNASRTMLFNIHTLEWDKELLSLFDIPENILPQVKASSEVYGNTLEEMLGSPVKIAGIAGDQQAALFGQMCTEAGMAKNTYGTGCFLVMNTGAVPVESKNNLLTTIAWKIGNKTQYALEGSVFVAGAAIQWLRDGIHLIPNSAESENLAMQVPDNGGVYFVPALTGLGAPYWDQYARGTLIGITRGTTSAHITRAALESIAYQTYDVLKAMESDSGKPTLELRVDGGAVSNNLLMQFQANVCQCRVVRPKIMETTALGAAYLAGLATGYWENIESIRSQWAVDRSFAPNVQTAEIERNIKDWHRAVERSKNWIED
ncbi:MAG: glycerol kinase GlpK [Bacteroidales bacterium]